MLVVLVGLGGAFLVGIHAVVALRWPSLALSMGLALGGLMTGVLFVESKLQFLYPWSIPAAVQNMSMPLVFGLQGRAGPGHIAVVVVVSCVGSCAVMLLGMLWLCRRDVP